MEENNQINPGQDVQQPESYQVEPLSKSEAMTGVITAPSETFETIAHSPKMNYWILPIIIFIVCNLIATFLAMNDADLMTNIMNEKKAALQQQFDEKVKSGDMTQEQANQSMEMSEKFMNPKGPFFQAVGYGFSVIGPFLLLFVMSVFILIIMKIFRSDISFGNTLNVVGLSLILFGISAIITNILSVLMGNAQTLSLGLLLNKESIGNQLHTFISALDVFSIWMIILISIGLSKIGKVSFAKICTVLFIIFLAITAVRSIFA